MSNNSAFKENRSSHAAGRNIPDLRSSTVLCHKGAQIETRSDSERWPYIATRRDKVGAAGYGDREERKARRFELAVGV